MVQEKKKLKLTTVRCKQCLKPSVTLIKFHVITVVILQSTYDNKQQQQQQQQQKDIKRDTLRVYN